jgi:hypothetical protein
MKKPVSHWPFADNLDSLVKGVKKFREIILIVIYPANSYW